MKFSKNIDNAVCLIDDIYYIRRSMPQSGWDLYSSGMKKSLRQDCNAQGLLECENSEWKTELRRDFREICGGRAVLTLGFNANSRNGMYFRISDGNGTQVASIELSDGMYLFCGEPTGVAVCTENTFFSIEFDFEHSTLNLLANSKHILNSHLDAEAVSHIDIGFEPHSIGKLKLHRVKLWTNFIFNDACSDYESGEIPDMWQTKTSGKAVFERQNIGHGVSGRIASVNALECAENSSASVQTEFEKINTTLCFETKYHTEKADGITEISLLCNGQKALTLTDDGKALYCGNRLLKAHSENVWQTLNTVSSVKEQSVEIMLDGTKCGKLSLCGVDGIDGVRIEYSTKNGGKLCFCDTFANEVKPEPSDYVPKPVKPKSLGYKVGMNVCSLWRNGQHYGWDPITPFYENRPILGYYDEGLSETADWEIKFMCEHGVDFQMFCWYNSEKNSPICNTNLQNALTDGYFKAKYAADMKFCIIFEVGSGVPFTSESFRMHIVPYWVDYFFTNPNYMTIDNKIVLAVFCYSFLYSFFGSPEKVKAEFDYLETVVKTLGFDGVIVICNEHVDEKVVKSGANGVFAYHHGINGYDEEYTKKVIIGKKASDSIHIIPTLSVGYNEVAWRDTRAPLMTTDTMGRLLDWFKTDALKTPHGNDDWKKKLVIMSTWNEYGEGTYISPSNLNGFGYLDEIRRAFTDDKPHTDTVPTERQKDRIGYLYPKSRTRLSALRNEQSDNFGKTLKRYTFEDERGLLLWKTEGLEYTIKDGRMCGISTSDDPKLVLTEAPSTDLSCVSAIKLKMKTANGTETLSEPCRSNDNTIIFYITDEDTVWNEAKCLRKNFVKDGYDYYIPDGNPSWRGHLKSIRIDPVNKAGSFELESVEIISGKPEVSIFIDGVPFQSHYNIRQDGDETYIYADFRRRFDILCGMMYTWDEKAGRLCLWCKDKKVTLTLSSDKYISGTKVGKLKKPLFFYDGQPYLPLSLLCSEFGYKAQVSDRRIDIETEL